MRGQLAGAVLLWAAMTATPAMAQAPAPTEAPPKVWTGNVSAGLALTAGNKDTFTFNASFEAARDPKTRNVLKASGLYLRGKTDGELTADQLGLGFRDEYSLNKRTFVFGQLRYLHDRFKQIDYLVAPSGGIGYKLYGTPSTTLSLAGGLGGVWEKDTGLDLQTSGALTFDQKLAHKLTETATLTQSVGALWKTSDFADALYSFAAVLAVSATTRVQLKVELLDTYKTKPPNPTVKENDVSLLLGVAYKF